jgi:hypothetical protein
MTAGGREPTDDGRDRARPRRAAAGRPGPPRWSPLRLPLLILFVGGLNDLLGRLLVELAPAGSDDDIAILGVQWQA